ncbi:hypothetical protein R6Q59_028385 [Mikania micrantha]
MMGSMFVWSLPLPTKLILPNAYEQEVMCPYGSSPSSVDCTLSLATPSTRLSNDYEKRTMISVVGSSWWNICNHPATRLHRRLIKANRGGGGGGSTNGSATTDGFFSRRCSNCDTTSTPLWRNGPRGPKSLCNACGIRYKKEERRANAARGGGFKRRRRCDGGISVSPPYMMKR